MPFRQCLYVHFVNFRKTVFTNLSYDIESAKKKGGIYWICILKQYISCSVTLYLILAKND
jgi:hypothetical protein